jgi:hypothetical protein
MRNPKGVGRKKSGKDLKLQPESGKTNEGEIT